MSARGTEAQLQIAERVLSRMSPPETARTEAPGVADRGLRPCGGAHGHGLPTRPRAATGAPDTRLQEEHHAAVE